MNMNDCFVVTEFNQLGLSRHFYPEYEDAFRAGKRFIDEDGAEKVEIKSPGGDCLRVFGLRIVQVK